MSCRFCYTTREGSRTAMITNAQRMPDQPCRPVCIANNATMSSISSTKEVINLNAQTTNSVWLQFQQQQATMAQQSTFTGQQLSTIQGSQAAIQSTLQGDLSAMRVARLQGYRTDPTAGLTPCDPPSVVELKMRTANVGVAVAPITAMECRALKALYLGS